MTVQRPPRDAQALFAQFIAGAAKIRQEKVKAHRDLAEAGLESALMFNALGSTLEHIAAVREVSKEEIEAVLHYAAAGSQLLSQAGPLEKIGGGGSGARKSASVGGEGVAAAEPGRSEGVSAAEAGRSEAAPPKGTAEKPEDEGLRGHISNLITTSWDTANQLVPLPEVEGEAIERIRTGCGGAQHAAQSLCTESGDIGDETNTEESMGKMLRKLMKAGRSI